MFMKKYLLLAVIGIVVAFIAYLLRSSNPIGTFVAKKNVNTIDSLYINENHIYYRVIYRKRDNKLLFKKESKWEYEDGRLLFHDFFPNDDSEIGDEYHFENVLMLYSTPLERSFGRDVFNYNVETAKYEFYKIY